MARYFLHLRDSVDELIDADGRDYADLETLKEAVLFTARDLMSGDIRNGIVDFRYRIDAEDANGGIVYSLPFKHALNIIPEVC